MGKGENAGYQHFLRFPTMFSKDLFLGVVKSRDGVVRSLTHFQTTKILDSSKLKAFADDKFR